MSERIQKVLENNNDTESCPSCKGTNLQTMEDEELTLSGLNWKECLTCRLVFISRLGDKK